MSDEGNVVDDVVDKSESKQNDSAIKKYMVTTVLHSSSQPWYANRRSSWTKMSVENVAVLCGLVSQVALEIVALHDWFATCLAKANVAIDAKSILEHLGLSDTFRRSALLKVRHS